MKLPFANAAKRDQIIYKLETYTLNFDHKKGQHKARVFRSKLGITIQNKEVFVSALLDAASTKEAMLDLVDEHGVQYLIEFMLASTAGNSLLRSRWIIRAHEQYPRLVSVYPISSN